MEKKTRGVKVQFLELCEQKNDFRLRHNVILSRADIRVGVINKFKTPEIIYQHLLRRYKLFRLLTALISPLEATIVVLKL